MLGCAILVVFLALLFRYSPQLAGPVLLGAVGLFFLIAFLGRVLPRPRVVTRGQVAEVLRDFLDYPDPVVCNIDGSFWDEFILHRIQDARLDAIRSRCATLKSNFPPERFDRVCSDEGLSLIREFLRELEVSDAPDAG